MKTVSLPTPGGVRAWRLNIRVIDGNQARIAGVNQSDLDIDTRRHKLLDILFVEREALAGVMSGTRRIETWLSLWPESPSSPRLQ